MFSDSSEISICVIVKHVQHTGIIKAFCLLGGGEGRYVKSFSAWGIKKIGGLLFIKEGVGVSTQTDNMSLYADVTSYTSCSISPSLQNHILGPFLGISNP